jgi:hypothetical protein
LNYNFLDAAEKAISRKSSQPPLRYYLRKPKIWRKGTTKVTVKKNNQARNLFSGTVGLKDSIEM